MSGPDDPLVAVVDLVTSVGGVQKVMAGLLPGLLNQFRIVVIDPYRNPEYAALMSGAGIETIGLGAAPYRRFVGGEGRLDRAVRLARRAPWLVATGLRLRRWAQEHRPALIYFNQLHSASFFERFLPDGDLPLLYHAHGFSSASDIGSGPRLSRRFSRLLAVSAATARQLVEAGVDPAKVTVVHNAVDAEDIRRRARRGTDPLPPRQPQQTIIVHAAALVPHKRQDLSIRALSQLPPHVVLWLCGGVPEGADPGYQQGLRSLASSLGVAERVLFMGWRDDVPRVLEAADVVVLPSAHESFGMVLVEAMALGKTCVASAVGGVPEVIEHGVTGLVVSPGEPAALIAALVRLESSRGLRLEMGAAGRKRVETVFSLMRQTTEVAEALHSAISPQPIEPAPAQRAKSSRSR